jgi:hypothetical protein
MARPAALRVTAAAGALALLSSLGLGACGGGGGNERSKPTSPPEETSRSSGSSTTVAGTDAADEIACALIDQDDARSLFGEDAVRAPDASPTHVAPTCIWKSASGTRLLQVRVWPGEQYYGGKQHPGAKSFGEGDRSFVAAQGANGETVQIVDGHKTYDFSYSIVTAGAPSPPDTAVEFAKFEQLVRQAFNSR